MSQEQIQKVWNLIKDIKYAMLTSDDGGVLRSRPMVASQKEFDGVLWFLTRADAHKVGEVQRDPRVNVSYSDGGSQNYVSLSGSAELVSDRATIKQHWGEAARVWFPKGPDDPNLAILKVKIQQAEYWDAPNSTMLHLYGYAKARLTGSSPSPGGHGKITVA